MKQPLNLLLYAGSLGMLGAAGNEFYHAVPKLGAKDLNVAHSEGQAHANKLVAEAQTVGDRSADWDFTRPFWEGFEAANFTGKLPPPPEVTKPVDPGPTVPVKSERPLHDVLTLVSVMADNSGDPNNVTQVGIRYKAGSGVQIPERVQSGGAVGLGGPLDVGRGVGQMVPNRARSGPRTRGNRDRGGAEPATPTPAVSALPTAGSTDQYVQQIVVGDALWAPFEHVKLKRVAEDGRSAFFVREQAGGESEEEEVFCNEYNLNNNDLATLVEGIREREAAARGEEVKKPPVQESSSNVWFPTPHTALVPGTSNERVIGEEDSRMFRETPEKIFEQVNLQPYTMRNGRRGLQVANVDPQLAARYGIDQGDIILEVNGQPVSSKAKAISYGRQQYDRGVRVFRVKVLSFGQEEMRVYHADER